MFHNAIEKSSVASNVDERVNNLIDCITYSVFIYTTRGLFEKHKLIFVSQMAFQVSVSDINYMNINSTPLMKELFL